MMLGHSGAKIEFVGEHVRKEGEPTTLAAQYEVLEYTGNVVFPRVFAKGEGWYLMERLRELSEQRRNDTAGTLRRMRGLLERHVWPRAALVVQPNPMSWREPLIAWGANTAPGGMVDPLLIDRLYSAGRPPERQVLTHGDPTIANLMERNNRDLCFIDPLKAGGKIPSFREVDIGKMLQSAIGWESQLDTGWPSSRVNDGLIAVVLEQDSVSVCARSFFWCAIHLLRIAVRDPERRSWAVNHAQNMMGRAEKALYWLA